MKHKENKSPECKAGSWVQKQGEFKMHNSKRWKNIGLSAVIIFVIAGCGNADSTNTSSKIQSSSSSVEDVLTEGVTKAEEVGDASETKETEEISSGEEEGIYDNEDTLLSDDGGAEVTQQAQEDVSVVDVGENEVEADPSVDIDLTALSPTMVYSEVYQMMYYPEDYIGKTVRMEGLYDAYHDENTGNDYYACIIQDATACCAQGIEFRLTQDYEYPDATVNEVEVKGTFQLYEEDGVTYCTLMDAELLNAF